jgi:hypothetical protein
MYPTQKDEPSVRESRQFLEGCLEAYFTVFPRELRRGYPLPTLERRSLTDMALLVPSGMQDGPKDGEGVVHWKWSQAEPRPGLPFGVGLQSYLCVLSWTYLASQRVCQLPVPTPLGVAALPSTPRTRSGSPSAGTPACGVSSG